MKEKFAESVERMLEEKVSECSMRVVQVNKNNGTVFTGIEFKVEEEEISPVFYVDDMFEAYVDGQITLEEITDIIAEWYKNHEYESVKVVVPEITKEWIEHNLVCCLINAEQNKQMLNDVPHRMFEDLAVIYRCIIKRDECMFGSMIVKNGMTGMSEQEMFEAALKNTKENSRFTVNNLGELIPFGESPLWVLTNEDRTYGANIMLYSEYFQELAGKLEDDLVVMPSSIHEVLVCPVSICSVEEAKVMVREVNRNGVDPVDVLGDNVYLFSRETGKLKIA